jgi:hypothetical protein
MLPALNLGVKRGLLTLAVVFASGMLSLPGATLERLSFDDLISKSTAIVRGTVTDSWAAFTGSIVYTHYKLQVNETFKGASQNVVEIVVTGGTVNGIHQNFSGSPTLNKGDQFVFFLWTSKAGLTQIMGLTQGLFALPPDGSPDGSSDPTATRAPTRELMLDPATAHPVKDAALSLRLSDMRSRIAKTLATGKGGGE